MGGIFSDSRPNIIVTNAKLQAQLQFRQQLSICFSEVAILFLPRPSDQSLGLPAPISVSIGPVALDRDATPLRSSHPARRLARLCPGHRVSPLASLPSHPSRQLARSSRQFGTCPGPVSRPIPRCNRLAQSACVACSRLGCPGLRRNPFGLSPPLSSAHTPRHVVTDSSENANLWIVCVSDAIFPSCFAQFLLPLNSMASAKTGLDLGVDFSEEPIMEDLHATEKRAVGEAALRWVRSGMRLGLGSGSTSHCFIEALGERVRSGELNVDGIATSRDSEELARQSGIPLIPPSHGLVLDLDVDGADEIAPDLSLIKGGGGALFREKVVAHASRYFLVLADASKLVQKLGAFPLPVEVVPFTLPWVMDAISKIGGNPVLRKIPSSPTQPYLTDQQNYILDCKFGVIESPSDLADKLEKIPGILEHGLFLGFATAALVARGPDLLVVRPNVAPEPSAKFQALP